MGKSLQVMERTQKEEEKMIFLLGALASSFCLGALATLVLYKKGIDMNFAIALFLVLSMAIMVFEEQEYEAAIQATVYNRFVNDIQKTHICYEKQTGAYDVCNACIRQAAENKTKIAQSQPTRSQIESMCQEGMVVVVDCQSLGMPPLVDIQKDVMYCDCFDVPPGYKKYDCPCGAGARPINVRVEKKEWDYN